MHALRSIVAALRSTLLLPALLGCPPLLNAQTAAPATAVNQQISSRPRGFLGRPIRSMRTEGVPAGRLAPIVERLPLAEGKLFTREGLQQSLRQLYASGLFETIEVQGLPLNDGVALRFQGQPRLFIGQVIVTGAKGATLNTELERGSQLTAGTRFTPAKLERAKELMRATLSRNGYPKAAIEHSIRTNAEDQIVDLTFTVTNGPRARIGAVELGGDPGMTPENFRHNARLKAGSTVNNDTANRALAGVLKSYQKQQRFGAEIKLEAQTYSEDGKLANFRFSATRGPLVEVRVDGAKLSQNRLQKLIPVFEEGAIDEDLLNEGNRRLRDYFQRQGYFEVKVEHERQKENADQILVQYNVQLGTRRRVNRVSVEGNHYFAAGTIADLFTVHTANPIDRYGAYSQSMVAADAGAIESLYHDNGFENVKVRPESKTTDGKSATLAVIYHVEEGEQTRVGTVALSGNEHVPSSDLTPLMNTLSGQLLSPLNLAGDRDALLTFYLSRGFDQIRVEVLQEPTEANRIDVTFRITEGQQIFVRKVLLRGPHFARQKTVAQAITLKPGDPLNQSALLETQRNLYEFALFNEVETTIQNPNGEESHKTILVQATEARRWILNYGFGFEAQTGQPITNCAGANSAGVVCNPDGKTGVSPRVLLDITRNGLFGREQSLTLKGTYGLLEQNASLQYQNPHFDSARNLGLTFSLGYANSHALSTYVSSKLESVFRLSAHVGPSSNRFTKASNFLYEFNFRRVKVDASSLQVYPGAIRQLSTAKRVAGPQFSWMRDTRDTPLDAHSGSYTSFQEFFSSSRFGAEVNFNRLDLSNATYHNFLRGKLVLARNTRYGQERAYGENESGLIPLPERLYGGGPTSHRGFSINAAGPRDPETGYPIGGAGVLINSTELRLPPPKLPWFDDTISFVLFHDMGNVFTNAGDAWESALRIRQPHRESCQPSGEANANPTPSGPYTSTGKQGTCSFNYFSHATGLGLRYHTPVGPIRLDFSYNLNPPVYPINIDYSVTPNYSNQRLGQAKHFNFIFSLGQTF